MNNYNNAFFVGSLLTEVASTLGPVQGFPALIFLTPSMPFILKMAEHIRGHGTREAFS